MNTQDFNDLLSKVQVGVNPDLIMRHVTAYSPYACLIVELIHPSLRAKAAK